MELIKKRVRTSVLGKNVVNQFQVEEDFNVPDSKNDVGRIISSEGIVKIEEIKGMEAYKKILGKLVVKVLYVTDTVVPMLASMEGSIPFEELIYMEDAMEKEMQIQPTHVELSVTVIHSRKLSIRGIIDLILREEKMEESTITIDLEEQDGIYKKYKTMQILELYDRKQDIFRIKEETTIPGTKENIGTILWTEVELRKIVTKVVQDAIQIDGELQLFCFYEDLDGKTDWVEQTLSFEGKIESPGTDEKMYHHIYEKLSDVHVDVKMDEDGEMRVLAVEGVLEIRFLIYEEENVSILDDLYSLKEKCVIETEERTYEELLIQNHSKYKITEQIHIPEIREEILQICHSSASAQIEKTEADEGGVWIHGILHVKFIYVKANDEVPFGMWSGMVPFSFYQECKGAGEKLCYDITYGIEQLQIELTGNGEVEVKAAMTLKCFLRRPMKLTQITGLSLMPYEKKELEKRPGIVGYIAKEGEELWNLAKQYLTTVESLKKDNNLEREVLKAGEKILIFKENISIL